MSNQLAPVSVRSLWPIQYQPQDNKWFKNNKMAISLAPRPNMVKELDSKPAELSFCL